MDVKHYRFLYGEMDGCFMHFGEIHDTKMRKELTFIYLREIDRHVNQEESDHTPFLFPERIDLIILGNVNISVREALRVILSQARADTLVVPDGINDAGFDFVPPETITLCLSVDEPERAYRFCAAGWKIFAKSYERGTVVFAHGLSCTGTDTSVASLYDLGNSMPGDVFKACEMQIELFDRSELQIRDLRAGSCGIQIDEGERKYCPNGGRKDLEDTVCTGENLEAPYKIGTVALSGEMNRIRSRMFRAELEENIQGICFVALCGKEKADDGCDADSAEDKNGKKDAQIRKNTGQIQDFNSRRCFIGMEGETEADTAGEYGASMQKNGQKAAEGNTLAALHDGQIVCCCGRLIYNRQ